MGDYGYECISGHVTKDMLNMEMRIFGKTLSYFGDWAGSRKKWYHDGEVEVQKNLLSLALKYSATPLYLKAGNSYEDSKEFSKFMNWIHEQWELIEKLKENLKTVDLEKISDVNQFNQELENIAA